jgi:hypothetical protein
VAAVDKKEMKWLKNLACKVFGHAPAFASLNLPNCCITCKAPMLWNPGTEKWDVMPPPSEHDVYRSLD